MEKLIRKKIQKNFILNNNNKIIRAWYLSEALGEHTYLPKKTGIFPVKIVTVKIKNPTTIQLNRIQLTSQTTNVEITKILSTGQRESKIIDY